MCHFAALTCNTVFVALSSPLAIFAPSERTKPKECEQEIHWDIHWMENILTGLYLKVCNLIIYHKKWQTTVLSQLAQKTPHHFYEKRKVYAYKIFSSFFSTKHFQMVKLYTTTYDMHVYQLKLVFAFDGRDFSTSFLTRRNRKGSSSLCSRAKPVLSAEWCRSSNSDQSSNLEHTGVVISVKLINISTIYVL